MKMHLLRCPSCNADLEIEDGINLFFCKYCGSKIMLEGQSKASINAKVKIKEFEHRERLQNNEFEHNERILKSELDQERYKLNLSSQEKRETICIVFWVLLCLLCLCLF